MAASQLSHPAGWTSASAQSNAVRDDIPSPPNRDTVDGRLLKWIPRVVTLLPLLMFAIALAILSLSGA